MKLFPSKRKFHLSARLIRDQFGKEIGINMKLLLFILLKSFTYERKFLF